MRAVANEHGTRYAASRHGKGPFRYLPPKYHRRPRERGNGMNDRLKSLRIVGLGKMGLGIARRLVRAGCDIVGFDPDTSAVRRATESGITTAADIDALVASAGSDPRVVWIMVPSGDATAQTLETVGARLTSGDILIDGGNSDYRDSIARGQQLAARKIRFLDIGTSGGVHGEREGFCLMVGGAADAVSVLSELLGMLAAGGSSGWAHVGSTGAGHFVKMIHNGIEYGMMQAYAEGLAMLHEKQDLEVDVAQVAHVWQHGSVVRSWLLELIAESLGRDASLADFSSSVQDSGEGRWAVREAIDLNVPAPVITLALLQRIGSRLDDSYTNRLLSAMRGAFGGHDVARTND